MEIILYYDKQGSKQWTIAERGNRVVEELIKLGHKREDFLVVDATGQIDKATEETFGY